MASKSPPFAWSTRLTGGGGIILLLCVVLSVLLCGDFLPDNIFFSNDGPLGRLMAECHRLPDRFFGCWQDLNSIGIREGGMSPDISGGLQLLLRPVWFSKLYVPVALLILGLGAWCCFRQWGLAPWACVSGSLAATLNSGFFSTACWGVAAHPITVGMSFFALAALADTTSRRRWVRTILAGLAVGMGVTEGADIGALFSLLVAAFVVYQAWVAANGPAVKKMAVGFGRLALLAACAVALATQALSGFISTGIEGVAGTEQDQRSRLARWDWATQWSLPKSETLSLVVPGLFGYRFNTPDGGVYWGAIGRDPEWDRYYANGQQGPQPTGLQRYVGGGSYVGVTVVLIALWAAAQSLRRTDSVFSFSRRRMLWFWIATGIVSLLLAFGRFAPFYALLFKLPYFSTIRNPVKFLHILSFSAIVLFAQGVDGLWRAYLQPTGPAVPQRRTGLRSWWTHAARFEKRWVMSCLVILGLSLVGWLIYASSRDSLQQHLREVQFRDDQVESIATFSIHQIMWFVLFFTLTAYLLTLIFSGRFAGLRAGWCGALLGLLVVADLGRANLPWIVFWDYKYKYATNAVIDVLQEKPYEHRVAFLPLRRSQQPSQLERLYKEEWLQQQFPYYNVQALDVVQMSRMPEDLAAFEEALRPRSSDDRGRLLLRQYELTNTRYLLGQSAAYDFLNQKVDPVKQRFRVVEQFDLVPKPGVIRVIELDDVTAKPTATGSCSLFEFTGALPRAKLYADWQVSTNDAATLKQLADASFDPQQTVLVAGSLPSVPGMGGTNHDAGTAEFASYASKDIIIKSAAPTPAVLLLNDRYDPHWKVFVDGRPETLLRCNYVMRGVYLAPGMHTVEFQLPSSAGFLYVSLSATAVGVLLLGFVLATGRQDRVTPKVHSTARVQPETARLQPKEKSKQSRGNQRPPGSKSQAPNSKPQLTHPPARQERSP